MKSELRVEEELRADESEGAGSATFVAAEDHLGLVWKVALKWARRTGLRPEELIGPGTEGLLRAIQTFDPGRGFEFSTYAVPWIEAFVRREVEGARGEGVSLQQPLDSSNGDEEFTLEDTLSSGVPLHEEVEEALLAEKVRRAVDALPKRLRLLAKLLGGFEGLPLTKEGVKAFLGVSGEELRELLAQLRLSLAPIEDER